MIFVQVESGWFAYSSVAKARRVWAKAGATLKKISHDTYIPIYN